MAFLGGPEGFSASVDTRRVVLLTVSLVLQLTHLSWLSSESPYVSE
jgi:hypothetical protein